MVVSSRVRTRIYLSLRILYATQSNNYMICLKKKSLNAAAAVILLLFLLTIIIPYGQQWHGLGFTAEAGEGECIDYDQTENTITINCDASFLDVDQTINDPGKNRNKWYNNNIVGY